MRRKLSFIFMALLLLGLTGCSTLNVNLTDEAKYLTALEWYNDNLETYLTHYRVQAPAVQAEWKAKYHPIFQAGDIALTTWKGTGSGENTWQEAKKQILAALLTLNIVEVK
jgi:hypothetical protein